MNVAPWAQIGIRVKTHKSRAEVERQSEVTEGGEEDKRGRALADANYKGWEGKENAD